MTRREFVGGAVATGVLAGAPAILRGRNLNNKLDIAYIACGGRAKTSLGELTVSPPSTDAAVALGGRGAAPASASLASGAPAPGVPHPDENVVVLCDVNQLAVDEAAQRFP